MDQQTFDMTKNILTNLILILFFAIVLVTIVLQDYRAKRQTEVLENTINYYIKAYEMLAQQKTLILIHNETTGSIELKAVSSGIPGAMEKIQQKETKK